MISTPALVTAVAALSAVSSLASSPSTFEYDARAVAGHDSEHARFSHVLSARFRQHNHIDGTTATVARRAFWERDGFEGRSIESSTSKPARRFARDSGALEGAPLEARDVKEFFNNVGNQARKLAEAPSLYFLRSEGEDEGLGRRDFGEEDVFERNFDDAEEMWAREPEFDYDMFERDDSASAASPQEQTFSPDSQVAQVPEQAPGSPLGSQVHELPGSPLGSPMSGSFSQAPVPENATAPEHAASEHAPEQQGATTPLVETTTATTTKTPTTNSGNKTTTATAGAASASGMAPAKGDMFTEFFDKFKHEAKKVANAASFFFRK